MAATAANGLPCDCRAVFRQTYWTSASRKRMSSRTWQRRKPAARLVVVKSRPVTSRSKGRPAPESRRFRQREARAGSKGMSLKFEIQPPANPTPEQARTAKLADPGFGRIFTDHMAIVRYNQAKGWHDARVEARTNFSLDPAAAILHYAQEIFEGLKAYKRDNGVNLFRPDANARRFRNSADRLAMAPVP